MKNEALSSKWTTLMVVLVLVGCGQTKADCWTPLVENYLAFNHEFYRPNRNLASIEEARAAMKSTLATCRDDAKYLYIEPYGSPDTIEAISLFDIAILTDDPDLVVKMLNRKKIEEAEVPNTKGLVDSENALQFAAFFESGNAVRELLRDGVDPNAVDEYRRNALHHVSASIGPGLQIIADLTNYGVDINAEPNPGATPIMFARLYGDLAKAQCLYALGARIPSADELADHRQITETSEAVREVESFLLSTSKTVPARILAVCTRDLLKE